MEETPADISQRADSYKFLSECYYPPDDELVQMIIDTAQGREFFSGLACCVPPVVKLELLSVDFAELTEAFVQNDMKTLAEHAVCDN